MPTSTAMPTSPEEPAAAPRTGLRILVALGGNAMAGPDGDTAWYAQRHAIETAMTAVAELIATGHEVVLTHGNGPQVGNLLVKNELAAHEVPPVPLDWCGAQTQATVGFTVQNALESALSRIGASHRTATVVTRTLVNADDPGFGRPTKPIGRHLPRERAEQFVAHGQIWEDRGAKGWRRVVASPQPIAVLDAATVAVLLAAGYIVVAAGGGGIPVVADAEGRLRGVEAVIDKDLTAALLAGVLDVDVLVIATDVDHVMIDFGGPEERPLERTTPEELRRLAVDGQFGSGSMAPKVEAAARFVEAGGELAVITALDHILEAVAGQFGTVVVSAAENANHREEARARAD